MVSDSDSDERQYTAGDVGRVTGMSYRQISDWDAGLGEQRNRIQR